MKKVIYILLMGILGLSGSLWAIGDEQEDRNARLFKAVQVLDLEGLEEAIEDGADMNIIDAEGYTPLFRAVKKGFGAQRMIQLLLDQGARMPVPIDSVKNRLLHQDSQKNASEPMSDKYVRRVLVHSAIQGNNTYALHAVFENIAMNSNKAEAVEFIRMVQDTQLTQDGLYAIARYGSKTDRYLLSLQHLIIRFSDETTITLFLEALKEVCGEQEAKQILFNYYGHSYKTIRIPCDGTDTPFEFLTYGSLIPASKERLLSFFKIVDTVFGEEMIQDVLMKDFFHRFLSYLIRPEKNNQLACSGDSSNLHLIQHLAQHVPLLLETLEDYLGEEILQKCLNSIDSDCRCRPLSCILNIKGRSWDISRPSFKEFFQSFYTPLNAVLKTGRVKLYCIPVLIKIEEYLGEGQNEYTPSYCYPRLQRCSK